MPYSECVCSFQILCVVCQNNNVNVTPGETTLQLEWTESVTDVNFTVSYGNAGNLTNENVAYTPNTGVGAVTHVIDNLTPGETYLVKVMRNGVTFYTSDLTTSKLSYQVTQEMHFINMFTIYLNLFTPTVAFSSIQKNE